MVLEMSWFYRILQKFFPRANQQEIYEIINEIQDKIDELMLDPYANYMFQSLAQSCSAEQRYYLLQKVVLESKVLNFLDSSFNVQSRLRS